MKQGNNRPVSKRNHFMAIASVFAVLAAGAALSGCVVDAHPYHYHEHYWR